ncbi:hypothetical protein MRM63_15415 [bacterium 19MO03SA05]|uniref:Uncharacterized protein n=1 Tax=bacterium 19MO03SA05 TaxID=2920620 RepID=A0AAU6VM42_UNCXX|nr:MULTISPECIES: hypothetical protein [unclassified Vibrio]EKO3713607.1 hypothetical protein [Vibrio metschnikovii]EKO3777144.1 hypothetical protein [Vibrio metschnikovii]EKO3777774.1 hypothetical protein [Vibrio metschnikovii]NAX01467.1 hypothetical protein [Vibrio sp. V34_P3A8T189]NAX06973.1 hypothetical protein [Vibrio sp. V40_P2S30T141]
MSGFKYEYQGVRGLKSISKLVGINYNTLFHRIHSGLTLEEAIAAGPRKSYPKVRKETGARKKAQQRAGEVLVGLRKPDQMDSKWALALGMRL